MRTILRAVPLVALLALTSCGGGSTPTQPDNTPPTVTNTITITAQGASPRNIQINAGSRVLFVNNDTRAHNMTSDPHPEHTTCPELNSIGLLTPGQSRESGNLNTVRTCGYHDHDNPGTSSLTGTITVR
jgi:plastocyanin